MFNRFNRDLRIAKAAYKKCVEAFPGHFFHLTWVGEEEVFVLNGNSDTLCDSIEFSEFNCNLQEDVMKKMYYPISIAWGQIVNPRTEYDMVNYTPEELAESEAYYERLFKERSALETETLELEAEVHDAEALESSEYEAYEAKVHKREAQFV